ncbi:putative Papain family cysteine protease [Blattamonas nauphoetae]|uniref:Papain family cysteine protease n=1 Tax=Blattamonas nauphoetae TaxID=2049346 RepID=A0ABQ9Y6C3_9EUKA|nr:putative Papain family cysteine protease [Blattamonas nauphoetae]
MLVYYLAGIFLVLFVDFSAFGGVITRELTQIQPSDVDSQRKCPVNPLSFVKRLPPLTQLIPDCVNLTFCSAAFDDQIQINHCFNLTIPDLSSSDILLPISQPSLLEIRNQSSHCNPVSVETVSIELNQIPILLIVTFILLGQSFFIYHSFRMTSKLSIISSNKLILIGTLPLLIPLIMISFALFSLTYQLPELLSNPSTIVPHLLSTAKTCIMSSLKSFLGFFEAIFHLLVNFRFSFEALSGIVSKAFSNISIFFSFLSSTLFQTTPDYSTVPSLFPSIGLVTLIVLPFLHQKDPINTLSFFMALIVLPLFYSEITRFGFLFEQQLLSFRDNTPLASISSSNLLVVLLTLLMVLSICIPKQTLRSVGYSTVLFTFSHFFFGFFSHLAFSRAWLSISVYLWILSFVSGISKLLSQLNQLLIRQEPHAEEESIPLLTRPLITSITMSLCSVLILALFFYSPPPESVDSLLIHFPLSLHSNEEQTTLLVSFQTFAVPLFLVIFFALSCHPQQSRSYRVSLFTSLTNAIVAFLVCLSSLLGLAKSHPHINSDILPQLTIPLNSNHFGVFALPISNTTPHTGFSVSTRMLVNIALTILFLAIVTVQSADQTPPTAVSLFPLYSTLVFAVFSSLSPSILSELSDHPRITSPFFFLPQIAPPQFTNTLFAFLSSLRLPSFLSLTVSLFVTYSVLYTLVSLVSYLTSHLSIRLAPKEDTATASEEAHTDVLPNHFSLSSLGLQSTPPARPRSSSLQREDEPAEPVYPFEVNPEYSAILKGYSKRRSRFNNQSFHGSPLSAASSPLSVQSHPAQITSSFVPRTFVSPIVMHAAGSSSPFGHPSTPQVQAQLPDFFDLRLKYAHCKSFHSPGDMGSCKAGWAFSASSMISDKLCINGTTNQLMSPEDLLQCDTGSSACSRGDLYSALSYVKTNGIVPVQCKSYRGSVERRCTAQCDDNSSISTKIRFGIEDFWYVKLDKTQKDDEKHTLLEKTIKQEITTYGSVSGSYRVTDRLESFMTNPLYQTEVYSPDFMVALYPSGKPAFKRYDYMKLVGWGQINSSQLSYVSGATSSSTQLPEHRMIKFWIIQQFMSNWGEDTFIRVEMMTTELKTEADLVNCYVPADTDPCSADSSGSLSFQCRACSERSVTTSNSPHQVPPPLPLSHRYHHRTTPPNITLPASNTNTKCGYCLSTETCVSIEETPVSTGAVKVSTKSGLCSVLVVNPSVSTNTIEPGSGVGVVAKQCPVDDCKQFSNSPIACVRHPGCGYCSASRMCLKGDDKDDNRASSCPPTAWIHSTTDFFSEHTCTLATTKEQCLEKISTLFNNGRHKCGWCESTQSCLEVNWMLETTVSESLASSNVDFSDQSEDRQRVLQQQFLRESSLINGRTREVQKMIEGGHAKPLQYTSDLSRPNANIILERPRVGRCPSAFFTSNISLTVSTPSQCSDLGSLNACQQSTSILSTKAACEWVLKSSVDDLVLLESGGGFCQNKTGGAPLPTYDDETYCNSLSCAACRFELTSTKRCMWCESASSCIAAMNNGSGLIPAVTMCTEPISRASDLVCTDCSSSATCQKCTQNAGCAWYSEERLCKTLDEVSASSRTQRNTNAEDAITAILKCPHLTYNTVSAHTVKTPLVSLVLLLCISFGLFV